jgi:hypothetical protein
MHALFADDSASNAYASCTLCFAGASNAYALLCVLTFTLRFMHALLCANVYAYTLALNANARSVCLHFTLCCVCANFYAYTLSLNANASRSVMCVLMFTLHARSVCRRFSFKRLCFMHALLCVC